MVKLACENIRFSALFAAGMFRTEQRLRLSDRNSILMMQINVYIINPIVMEFKYKFVYFYVSSDRFW